MPREIITLQLGQCGNQSEWAPQSGGTARTARLGRGRDAMGDVGGACRGRGRGPKAGVADRRPRSWVRVLEAALRRARHQPRGHRGGVCHRGYRPQRRLLLPGTHGSPGLLRRVVEAAALLQPRLGMGGRHLGLLLEWQMEPRAAAGAVSTRWLRVLDVSRGLAEVEASGSECCRQRITQQPQGCPAPGTRCSGARQEVMGRQRIAGCASCALHRACLWPGDGTLRHSFSCGEELYCMLTFLLLLKGRRRALHPTSCAAGPGAPSHPLHPELPLC